MLLVNTRLGPSKIHGIGVFATEFIPEGTRVWEVTADFDRKVPRGTIESLPPASRAQMLMYSYTESATGLCVICADNARHENHANDPNTREVHGKDTPAYSVAARDIHPGEEITCDYRTFDAAWREKLGADWPELPRSSRRPRHQDRAA